MQSNDTTLNAAVIKVKEKTSMCVPTYFILFIDIRSALFYYRQCEMIGYCVTVQRKAIGREQLRPM
jgi:hypothetical protein